MGRIVAIGIQDFGEIIKGNYFYVDKSEFIKKWWESGDSVTLINRPRRFGKTLTISMLDHFFSIKYREENLFEEFAIWKEEKYQKLKGSYPVVSLSFARVKEKNYEDTKEKICEILRNLYIENAYLRESSVLIDADREYFNRILAEKISNTDVTSALYKLSEFLYRYYGKKVIILLDEYDTPMQEAYINGYWEELAAFMRNLFNSAFKTNPYLARGLLTGITRVSKESIFSDLNNIEVITTTSDKYATTFGFTEEEVFAALDEAGLSKEKEEVKHWYDGFVFGKYTDIYNPWSIINFLDKKKYDIYWANTSANSLVGKLLREGNRNIKQQFESLLNGEILRNAVDEQIVYNQLDDNDEAIWSLLLASGYLKVLSVEEYQNIPYGQKPMYDLAITNTEVKVMFGQMVKSWFGSKKVDYNCFIKALLSDNVEEMNIYMNEVSMDIFSSFDSGNKPSRNAPERFYHGFVLGLVVDLHNRYIITSNRESGYGRYDVMLEPKQVQDNAIIMEFKVYNERKEKNLHETAQSALAQIEQKKYESILLQKGIEKERIRKYGFAFEGKKVRIESDTCDDFDW